MKLTCKQRWKEQKDSRIRDLRRLMAAYNAGEDSPLYKKVYEELGDLNDYGLSLDYVPVGTFGGQLEAFWRWQFSWGGPADELRFFASTPTSPTYKVEYWFLDYFDGYGNILKCKDRIICDDIWGGWVECDTPKYLMDKALE